MVLPNETTDFREQRHTTSLPLRGPGDRQDGSGHKWNKADRAWEYPIRPETYTKLVEMFPGVRVDRQVITAITQVAEREAAVAQAKVQGWEGVEPVEPMPIKSKPFAHQILGHNLGLFLPNVAFFQDMGTGKTITSISVAGRRYLRGEIKRLLVVAPNSVVPNWEVEFGLHAAFPYEVKILDGAITKRCEILKAGKKTLRPSGGSSQLRRGPDDDTQGNGLEGGSISIRYLGSQI